MAASMRKAGLIEPQIKTEGQQAQVEYEIEDEQEASTQRTD